MKKILLSALLCVSAATSVTAADIYRLVDDAATLSAGDKLIIAATQTSGSTALGTTQNPNNRAAVEVTISNNEITNPGTDIEIITLENSGNDSHPWLLKVAGGYLYSPQAQNYLRTAEAISETGEGYYANITIAEGVTKVAMNRGTYQIQKNSTSALFSCYNGTQTKIQLYRLDTDVKAVATPVISMVEQGEGFAVTMSCATEGAEIRYTADGTTPTAESTLYTAPLECWSRTTYKAVAVKDGEFSNVATFTANPPYILEGFSNLYDFMSGMEPNEKVPVIIKGAMTALYQKDNYLFVKAGTGFMGSYMLVYGNVGKTLNNGDSFERLEGEFMVYSDQPEISAPSIVGEVTPGTAVDPEEIADLTAVADYNLNHYVYIENVTISGVNGRNAIITDAEGNTCAIYNRFDIDLADAAGCKVTGFVTKNRGVMQIWPTEIVANAGVVAAPTFNPESGATIPMYSEITISAEEGAEIYCMVEGFDDEFRLYEGPEPATPAGELIIKAFAKKGEASSDTITATYTVTKPLPELGWMNANGELVKEVVYVIDGDASQQVLPEPTGMMMGEPTLTSSNPEVAVINEYMGVDIVGVGETTITLSVSESSMYAAGSASFLLKVISKADAGDIAATVEFSNPANEGFSADAKEKTWESTGGTYLFKATAAIDGSTYPVVNSGQLRLYGSSANTITVAAPTGYQIKAVIFSVDQNNQDWLPTVDDKQAEIAGNGSRAAAVECGVTLPTAASQVTIGCGGTTKHIRLNSITFVLTEAASGIESIATEAADGAAEYYNLQGVRIANPEAGLYIRRQGGKASKVVIR